jgi:hypothetical protein
MKLSSRNSSLLLIVLAMLVLLPALGQTRYLASR